jgi:hypothetical protein
MSFVESTHLPLDRLLQHDISYYDYQHHDNNTHLRYISTSVVSYV